MHAAVVVGALADDDVRQRRAEVLFERRGCVAHGDAAAGPFEHVEIVPIVAHRHDVFARDAVAAGHGGEARGLGHLSRQHLEPHGPRIGGQLHEADGAFRGRGADERLRGVEIGDPHEQELPEAALARLHSVELFERERVLAALVVVAVEAPVQLGHGEGVRVRRVGGDGGVEAVGDVDEALVVPRRRLQQQEGDPGTDERGGDAFRGAGERAARDDLLCAPVDDDAARAGDDVVDGGPRRDHLGRRLHVAPGGDDAQRPGPLERLQVPHGVRARVFRRRE
mmetsp:Transcript_24301/g.75262  ORF Transcript_24301/g.75262 Transcript_24301/m.75262 type:complete len:281 (-) Transcript_24301:486-1328(-)